MRRAHIESGPGVEGPGHERRRGPRGRRRAGFLILTLVAALGACEGREAGFGVRSVPAAPAEVTAVVWLVGDAGEDNRGRGLVLDRVKADLEAVAARSPEAELLVLFLGDNIYDDGARPAHESEDRAHLVAQAAVIESVPRARAVFLPGNHDWARGAADPVGRRALALQETWVGGLGERTALLPGDGCPGPVALDVGSTTRVLLLDTEWLLRRPEDECGTVEAVFERLAAALDSTRGRRVLVAAHHPLASGGPHGGNVGPFEKGPLVYWAASKLGFSRESLASPPYRTMVAGFERAVRESGVRPLAFLAGHDHSLQVIRLGPTRAADYQIVSGSGSRTTPARAIDGTRFARGRHGYVRLDFAPTTAFVTVFSADAPLTTVEPVFGCALEGAAGTGECPEAPIAR